MMIKAVNFWLFKRGVTIYFLGNKSLVTKIKNIQNILSGIWVLHSHMKFICFDVKYEIIYNHQMAIFLISIYSNIMSYDLNNIILKNYRDTCTLII